MAKLSDELVSQFVKATNDTDTSKKETTVYGTVVSYNSDTGEAKVRLDGARDGVETPAASTIDAKEGDRVAVVIKNHTAMIVGSTTVTAVAARVSNTIAKTDLDAINIEVSSIAAEIADLGLIRAKLINVKELAADQAYVEELNSKLIRAIDLKADKADFTTLESDVAKIDSLIFGSAGGDAIQTSFSNAVVAQIGDAQIKSAMIHSISAGKITSGDLLTNNVRVVSEDGRLVISDETIQISDATRVRVQIGKDAANDYSINIWDAEGRLMFSEGGLTDSAIKDAIIRDGMVSETANISASKLNIDSLFQEINGSTNTITSTKIYLNDEAQTLDLAFKKLSDDVSSQGTTLSILQGEIEAKVWEQDINKATGEMNTKYSSLEQNVNGLSTTVADHTTTLDSQSTKITTLTQTADGLTVRLTDAESDILDAAKTATNYISATTGGLVVGDMTLDSLGNNVCIDSDSVDIRYGDETRASFGEDYIYLGKHSRDATIDLCNGLAKLYHTIDDKGYSQFNIDTTYALSYAKISAPMTGVLVLENTHAAGLGTIVKTRINGSTVGGFGLVRDGYMVRYGSDADEDDAVAYRVHDEENFGTIDSDWKYGGVLGENFTIYDNNTQIQYRKIGKIVEIRGVVRPTTNIPGSSDNHTIFTLPSGYRPSTTINERCQGSGSYSWLLSITSSGLVRFARYNDGTQYVDTSTTSWLPFHATFFVD